MRRASSTFFTLWVLFLVPSTIIWGLMLRAGDRSAAWFESAWHRVIHLLTFPLLVKPLTDWSWKALDSEALLSASLGFSLLVSVWAASLAVPLVLVDSWWMWLANRDKRSAQVDGDLVTVDGYTYSMPEATYTTATASPLTPSAPLRALYLITIPFALFWVALCWIVRPLNGSRHPILGFLAPVLIWFGLVFTVMVGLYWAALTQENYVDWRMENLASFADNIWTGYLDAVKIPRLFDRTWWAAYYDVQHTTLSLEPNTFESFMDKWYLNHDMRVMIVLLAARHALGVAIVVLIWRVVHGLLRS